MTDTIQKQVLLIIGGGIAAYKTPELVRGLRKGGYGVTPLLTAAAEQFVSPLSLASVAGQKVYQNLFDLNEEAEMGHIQLSRQADMVVVAPASADLLSKMAQGLANDLASAVLLANNKPVFVAPAMNVHMWHHPATKRNIKQLQKDGVQMIGPEEGDMACGEYGLGRMSEPAIIIETIMAQTESHPTPQPTQNLKDKNIIITAGPTYEPLDPVRYIANRSSGKQGYAIAEAMAARGAKVHLISGPTQLAPPTQITFTQIETAQDMWQAAQDTLETLTAQNLKCDAAICAAAVADWRPLNPTSQKIKKQKIKKQDNQNPSIELTENPDILANLASHKARPTLVIGFAAETENMTAYAQDKRRRKQCDWMIANNVGGQSGSASIDEKGGVMGGDYNYVQLISEEDCEQWQVMSKAEVAATLADKIAITLDKK